MGEPAPNLATFDALAALGEDMRAELLGGAIVEKAPPSFEHGHAQLSLGGLLQPAFGWRGGSDPGGWWFASEVDVELTAHDVVRPDVLGWRRDGHPARPSGRPVRVRPDWIAEILSTSNAANDTVKKLNLFHRVGVPHTWLVDPERHTLTVLRWSEAGYVTALAATGDDVVRAEPFDELDLPLARVFGDG
jgi:Uma2 family endonuclease